MKGIFIKTLILLAFVFLSFKTTQAQFVTIPDANFVSWLYDHGFSQCLVGNQLDTTCSLVTSAASLNGNDPFSLQFPISNLTGIEYFDSLTLVDFSNHQISIIPRFPGLLQTINLQHNFLMNLPALPQSLNSLNCSMNSITILPNLPSQLNVLNCSINSLSAIPIFPPSLKYLYCYQNLLTALPLFPDSLKLISCESNQIATIPALPLQLTNLICSNNQINMLPNLPNGIDVLVCNNNSLSNLPNLPNTLRELYCHNNLILELPTLPNYLEVLRCKNNNLTILPQLPNTLIELSCENNNISCFPVFPQGISSININGNSATCLPNYLSSMNLATLNLPLCIFGDTINNPNLCSTAIGILGTVFEDDNGNCIMNVNDSRKTNVKINIFNALNNQFGSTYSAINGMYHYPCNVATYFVLIDTLNNPYQANCNYPGIDSLVVTTVSNPLASNVNFDIKCKPSLDLNVQSVNHKDGLIFPGQQHTLLSIAGDASQWYGLNCASGTGGQVQITINGPVTYNGPAVGALTPTVNGNVYTYTIADFGAIDNATDFQMLFTTDTTAQAGNQICVHTEVTPMVGDVNPTNNINDYCYIVHNSYDPNYKEVYPTDVAPLFQDWLTYTIHFQNLGTAPAINIRLLDTLDSNLDAETFEVINYSHYNTVTLMDGILDFRFPNILLPDSASNPNGSQGFVQYRIKPKANLGAGTQIENTAHIYFDYNPAVVTNTTVNNFITTVSNKSLPIASRLWLYPNPSTGIFNISASANIEVYNLIGDLILSENNTTSIDLTAAPKGMYYVKLNGGKIEKLIKN